MPKKLVLFGAVTGSTLLALSLAGSLRNPANPSSLAGKPSLSEIKRLHTLGMAAFSAGRYLDAREAYRAAASGAFLAGLQRDEAMNWSNAGFASVLLMQYGPALTDLTRARLVAQRSGEMVPLIYALNNLTGVYLQMGVPDQALRLAREALAGPAGHAHAGTRAKLLYQEAQALATLGRLPEAEPLYRQSLGLLVETGDLDTAARSWAGLGHKYIDAGRYADAEPALNESLRLTRTHRLKAATSALTGLARLRAKQGDYARAEYLLQDALDAHETFTPRWMVYLDRARIRLESGHTNAALRDFREARRLATVMRADIVPADQDRIALENRVSQIFDGLVDAGNRLAVQSRNRVLLAETFDAAEQDRLWSLRATVPETSDWRSRLPADYWELLARFQAVERSLLAQASPAEHSPAATEAVDLEMRLQLEEAAAGAAARSSPDNNQPSRHVEKTLDSDTVLFSFSITDTGSWLWVVDNRQMRVFSLPDRAQLDREVQTFNRALQDGRDSTPAGKCLWQSLFGKVPAAALAHKHWLLEPDGPLHELPFAALPVANNDGQSRFLIENAALQTIPGALLLKRGVVASGGSFVGIGDPVFNEADPRYRGSRGAAQNKAITLPRLPNTAVELAACSLEWNSGSRQVLTGAAANIGAVESALSSSPAAIHFATHVVRAPGQFGSGLLALALDANGAIGLMGPQDIAARRLNGALVVMNGCHSGQGNALPASGLMGLTRAWIGAGANAVISTRWNIPDEPAQTVMVDFYRALRGSAHGNPAAALREAQLAALHSGRDSRPLVWAGYFLLSRI